MAAKKAPKRAQADQPANESCGSAEPTTDGEATTTLASAPQSASTEDLTAHNTPEQLQRLQLFADIAARIYRALTKWLTHEQKHMRVLGWISWLFLLALLGALVVVLIVLVFRWHPLYTIAIVGASTGLVAGSNLVSRHLRRRR